MSEIEQSAGAGFFERPTAPQLGPEAPRVLATRLAEAALRVAEEITAVLEGPSGRRLQPTLEQLSESLGSALTGAQLAKTVAEVAALGWIETGGEEAELPEPLQAIEVLLAAPAGLALEAALEALRAEAAREAAFGLSAEDVYEDFLAALDPQARTGRSVYLTPAPLVRMLVRSVDELLGDRLGLPVGLASPEVGLLDPAAGTGAFLLEALRARQGREEGARVSERSPALWQGFEIQPGAYAAGALRVERRLEQQRAPCPVRLHLRDLLAEDSPLAPRLSGPELSPWGEPEPSALVVLGNPPWSDTGQSSSWVDRLLREGYRRPDGSQDDGYHRCGGSRLASRNTKWLRSRYVAFLRVAQWCVDRVGRGVVALVLSDGIADNFTFHGLRESLLGSFETIYLFDLGGSGRKWGSRGLDGNLFGVRQGACALILVKEGRGGPGRTVRSFELRGSREDKLGWLDRHTVRTTPWQRAEPRAPGHVFVPRRSAIDEEYRSAPTVREIFEVGSVAVVTGCDRLLVGFETRELAARIALLREGRDAALFGLRKCRGLDPDKAIAALVEDEEWERHLVPYLVRPGDHRVLFAAPYLVARPRSAVMAEIHRPGNLALLLPRRRRVLPAAWVTDRIASHRVASAYEGSYAFPLYIGPERRPNLAPAVLGDLATRYGAPPSPEQVLGFIYALLWSRDFHEAHRDDLRQDWPRVPFPQSLEDFTRRAETGWKRARFHLGWERTARRPWFHGELPVRLPQRGMLWRHESDRLHLGWAGHLAPVGPEVMERQVGGYRLVEGWIRRRAGRGLEAGEVEELCRLVEVVGAMG